MNSSKNTIKERPPVVVVMGHVDHGKSALLDYIRKTNVVDKEVGGITQRISAYEVEREYEGEKKKITFIDTPGHEAFRKMREHGASVADIAILVVSAEDGVKPQTLEALQAIKDTNIPFCVAINKIDKPGANIQQTQTSLIENEIYIEGMGGDIPWNAISAKTGEGVDDLLDTILLLADMEELSANPNAKASGVIIEAHIDPKTGINATLIIKDGTLHTGEFVVAGNSYTPIRTIIDSSGKKINSASFSSPIGLIGFNKLPKTGDIFSTVLTKKEAERKASEFVYQENDVKNLQNHSLDEDMDIKVIPIVLKAETKGALEAIEYELSKVQKENPRVLLKIIEKDAGSINQNDINIALANKDTLVLGFSVRVDNPAKDLARNRNVEINLFNIIYELTDWVSAKVKELTPKQEIEKEVAVAKVLKIFSEGKKSYVIGGKVKSGTIKNKLKLHILRRNEHLFDGEIITLKQGKQDALSIAEGNEFGAEIKTGGLLAEGDVLVFYEVIEE